MHAVTLLKVVLEASCNDTLSVIVTSTAAVSDKLNDTMSARGPLKQALVPPRIWSIHVNPTRMS